MVRAQTDVAHAVLPARVHFFLLFFPHAPNTLWVVLFSSFTEAQGDGPARRWQSCFGIQETLKRTVFSSCCTVFLRLFEDFSSFN